jgi:hypothetical protein
VLTLVGVHGLRKAGATIAADNGATAHQRMAIFGWTTLKQAEVYRKKADQKRLAGVAMRLLVPGQFGIGNRCWRRNRGRQLRRYFLLNAD